MDKNMGKTDRIMRIAVALVLLAIGIAVKSWLSYLLFALAGIMMVTAAIGVCPAYYPFGINTHTKKKAKKR